MNGQEILGNVAFYVSIAVVIGMAIMFSILFAIYGFYKIKHINYGHEDAQLEKTLRNRYKEIIERNSEEGLKTKTIVDKDKVNEPDYVMVQNLRNVKTFTLVGEKEVEKPLEPKTVLEAIFEEKRKSKKWRVVSNVFFAIFYVLLLILLGFSIAFKATNQQLFLGNSGLVAIYTGSMETMNDENTYLEEEGLTSREDRIMQYSLIGVDKVTSPDQIELYKIYGYRTPEGNLIVHRLIRIYTNPETNVTYYTFRGDANSDSLSFELVLTFDDIECVYNGFQNFGLGVATIYLQSNIGLIAILAAFLFLITYQSTEHFIEVAYDKRTQEIAKKIDGKEYILDLRTKKDEESRGEDMISLRKTLVTLLAPIGAATIIGTGFAYWTFNMSPVTVEADPISNSANITGEVTNGNVELLSIPSILVFSEGSQGASDPFDGLSFYSHKPIQEGVEFDITLGNDSEHMLSLIYTNVSNNPMVYFSWSENNQYSSIISGELTQTTTSDSYVGTWTGTGKNGAGNLFDVTLTLNTLDQTSNSGTGRFQIALDEGQSGISFATVDDNFSYSPISSSTIPDITITDSTLSFKYTYDDSIFVDEDQTGYELNVKMRLSLESREPVVINPTKESGGQHLIYSGTGYTFMMGVNNDGTFNLEVVVSGQKIYFPNLTLSRIDGNGDTTFPNGVYSGESLSRIPCEVTLQSNGNDTFTATIEMGKMDHYLEVVDNFTSRVNPEDGYYSITTSQNETYSEAVLGFDIDRTHLNDEDSPYLTFTCQLATFIRYASINVKPVDPQSFFGLQVASTYGGWKLRVQICADFVSTRG